MIFSQFILYSFYLYYINCTFFMRIIKLSNFCYSFFCILLNTWINYENFDFFFQKPYRTSQSLIFRHFIFIEKYDTAVNRYKVIYTWRIPMLNFLKLKAHIIYDLFEILLFFNKLFSKFIKYYIKWRT